MLKSSGLSNSFWVDAISTASYVQNSLPTATLHKKTPYESWHGSKPSVGHSRVFGCLAYVHIPDEKRKKLDDKSKKCIMIRYSLDLKAYRLYDPSAHEIIISRDIIFD